MSLLTLAYFLDLNHTYEEKGVGEVCIANISPVERQKRMRFGIQAFIFTLVVLGIIVTLNLNQLWRLPLLLLFWVSAIGYFQAREKT